MGSELTFAARRSEGCTEDSQTLVSVRPKTDFRKPTGQKRHFRHGI